MPSINKCPYVYGKGDKSGTQCGKGCVNEFCHKHMPKTKPKEIKKEIEENDNESIVSTVDIESEITEKSKSSKKSKKQEIIKSDNDEILITKYFVYDCIRDFFKDYNDINSVLGNKTQSSSSNMGSILTMAGLGCLPLILKNISGLNIQDALFKQTSNNTACNSTGIYGQFDKVTNNAEQKGTQEGAQAINQSDTNIREIQKAPEIYDKCARII